MKTISRVLFVLVLMIGVVLVSGCASVKLNERDIYTNIPTKYEPEVLEAFQIQTKVRVIVELKDNSNVTVTGTREEKMESLKQKEKWFGAVIGEVLATLPEQKFKLVRRSFDGFSGEITKEGFDILINNTNVNKVYLDVVGGIS